MLPIEGKTASSKALSQTNIIDNNAKQSTVTVPKRTMVDVQTLSQSTDPIRQQSQFQKTSDLRSATEMGQDPLVSQLNAVSSIEGQIEPSQLRVKINTSNRGKFSEFSRLFLQHDFILEASHIDLDEIDADPISVVVHKASQLPEGCLVEDTSLDVAGQAVGVNVRWLSQDLPNYMGKPAVWRTLLAIHNEQTVSVYQGEVSGVIVAPRGDQGFGFDPYFIPDGQSLTLAQDKPDHVNARALAVNAYCQQKVFAQCPPILNWQGPWQKHSRES